MHANVKVVLAFGLVVAMPLYASASAQGKAEGTLTAKEAHQLERTANTAVDHARLADFYRLQAHHTEQKLAGAKEQMRRASWLESSTKVPNAYTIARNNVDRYSAELEKYSKLALAHDNSAKFLQAGNASSQQVHRTAPRTLTTSVCDGNAF